MLRMAILRIGDILSLLWSLVFASSTALFNNFGLIKVIQVLQHMNDNQISFLTRQIDGCVMEISGYHSMGSKRTEIKPAKSS